jgi:hypothetical protein
MQGCEAQAFEDAFADSSSLIRFSGSFEGSNARFDVFKLDSLKGVIKYKIGRPESNCRRCTRISQKLQGDRSSSASRLLQSSDSLLYGFTARLAILLAELR